MNRRDLIAMSTLATNAFAAPEIPILDAHIHLFDPRRPQGIPWPPKDNAKLYQPALPERYLALAKPLGIAAAIMVECSQWLEDNQWVLNTIAKNPEIVGMIGNLEPGKPDFGKNLDRFHRNPLWLGMRYGNLWGRNLGIDLQNPQFLADMKLFSQTGLTLDSANPNLALLGDLERLLTAVPDLRLVIDHLPQATPPADASGRKQWDGHLKALSSRPTTYVKVSEILRRVEGQIPADIAFYRERLDGIFALFGEDRVVFGSDWPNSDNWKPLPDVVGIAKSYFATKPVSVQEKYFWRNSVKAYRWKTRPGGPVFKG